MTAASGDNDAPGMRFQTDGTEQVDGFVVW